MKKSFSLGIIFLILMCGIENFAQKNHPLPPAPTYSSLLSSFIVKKDGKLDITGGWGYFFTHKKGVIKVLRNGEYFDEYEIKFSPSTPPFYSYDIVQLKSWQKNNLGLYLKKPGNYELEFYMGGKKFYSFPFELKINSGDDAYNPNKIYRIDGAWNDYAFLYRRTKRNDWEFRAWYRSPIDDIKPTKYSLKLTRDSDNKVIALSSGVFRRERYWKQQVFVLRKKMKRANGEVYLKDLDIDNDKFEDGSYTIKTMLDRKPHRTFKFTTKGGEILHQGRQIRNKTNPLQFIEGGKNQFWIKKTQ